MQIVVTYTLEEVPDKGWVAHAQALRATASGETREEAVRNLEELIEAYPEAVRELLAQEARAEHPHFGLIPA